MSFTWINFFEELADKVLNFRNNQKRLIEILKKTDMFDKGLTDRDSGGNYFPMNEIDPFTFFSLIVKFRDFDKRKIVFKFLKTELHINAKLPEDNDGVPSSLAVSSWLIAYKADRQGADITTLWDLFEAALKNDITNELFERALNIKGAGYSKVTQGLFRIRPRLYFPIDKQTKPFLGNNSISFDCMKTKRYSDYKECLNNVKQAFPDSEFYVLSKRAWEEQNRPVTPGNGDGDDQPDNEIHYWIYAPGRNAKFWEECYENNIMLYGADELSDLRTYESKTKIEEAFKKVLKRKNRPTNIALAAWEFSRVIKPGDIIIAKKGSKNYIGYGVVTGPYVYDKNRSTYRNSRNVQWEKRGEWIETGSPIVQKTLTDITQYSDYVEKLRKLIGIEDPKLPTDNPISASNALNMILYGPPGTGKTYRLKNEFFAKFTDERSIKTKAEFCEDIARELAWWQIISIVMIDLKKAKVQDVFEHPLLQAKTRISENKTPKNTIWSWLQRHTKNDCPNVNFTKRDNPQFFWKDEKSLWSIDEEMARVETPDFFDVLKIYHSYQPETKTEKRYVFTTFHQSYSYEDFIEGIKPRLLKLEDEIESQDVNYHIENGIFKEIAQKAELHPEKDYAIFIDEINRGNIANIFGELITLIEEDKRIDTGTADKGIRAVLPYSKKEFGIPKNLYIIGTMNTADRSVEALDTALRRRFSFVYVPPAPEKLAEEPFACVGIELNTMLTAINSRIEKLLDSDYCIGHSYFMTIENREKPLDELKTIFQNKIIPLLQEYFYGHWGKIGLVLGKGFIEKKNNLVKFLATDEYEDYDEFEEKPVYHFTDPANWTIETFKSIYE